MSACEAHRVGPVRGGWTRTREPVALSLLGTSSPDAVEIGHRSDVDLARIRRWSQSEGQAAPIEEFERERDHPRCRATLATVQKFVREPARAQDSKAAPSIVGEQVPVTGDDDSDSARVGASEELVVVGIGGDGS